MRVIPFVKPVGGESAYLGQREKRFNFSPPSKVNYHKYLEMIKVDPSEFTCNYKPWKYQLEPNSSCNLSCTMCAVSEWKTQKRAPDLSLDQFHTVIRENECLLELNLCPLGEPLMRGDDYFEMGKFARSQEIWTRTVTNATLLAVNENYKKMAAVGFNEIVISIDSFDDAEYASIRRGSNLSKVLSNVELFHNHFVEQSISIPTKLNAVLTTSNKDSLYKIIQGGVDLGFTNISITVDSFNWGIESFSKNNVYDQLDVNALSAVSSDWGKQGINVGYVLTTNRFLHKSPDLHQKCSWPFSSMYIGSDLRYPPCCHVGDPDVFEILPPQASSKDVCSPLEVWFSSSYDQFRRSHFSSGNLPDVCKACYVDQ